MASQNLRVAILQNFMIEETGGRPMIERISQLILLSKPHAEITVYAPIQGDAFPEPDAQDLIILTGGPYDLMGGNNPRWVDDTLDFIKAMATSCSKPKVLGICWGQQAIALSLKGTLGKSKRGHCVGVENIPLKPDGVKFFNAKALDIHKNHEIVVTDIGPHLSPLAPNNEILLSTNGQILTFQGHPEMDHSLSKLFAPADGQAVSINNLDIDLKPIASYHDGERIFERIMAWVTE